MYYTKMRWQMTGLMATYFFTLGYGLQQLHLFWLPYFPLYLGLGGAILALILSPLWSRISPQKLSPAGLTWAWCNAGFLNLLLWFYTNTSKYLN